MRPKSKFRTRDARSWTQVNEILALGEPGFEKDTNQFKIGDGVTPWQDRDYCGGGEGGGGSGEVSYQQFSGDDFSILHVDPNEYYVAFDLTGIRMGPMCFLFGTIEVTAEYDNTFDPLQRPITFPPEMLPPNPPGAQNLTAYYNDDDGGLRRFNMSLLNTSEFPTNLYIGTIPGQSGDLTSLTVDQTYLGA